MSEEADAIVTATAADRLSASNQARVIVCAVGGSGRCELFPFSDIDLLLLFENENAIEASKPAISDFISALWDGGLHASHSVRTVAECAEFHENNIELHISLLDVRPVWGDTALFDLLTEQIGRAHV